MKHAVKLVAVFTVISIISGSAIADDMFPAPFRGQFNTSWGMWEFDTPADPAIYNDGLFPFGDPYVDPQPGTGLDWYDVKDGRQGVWPLSGEMWVTLQNGPDTAPNTFKDIWVQLTWRPQNVTSRPIMNIRGHSEDPTYSEVILDPLNEIDLENGWKHTTFHLLIFPNPSWETLMIEGAIDLDEMVIDTQCVPEPASLAILGVGALFLLHRKNR